MRVDRLTEDDWAALREIRLRSLRDGPAWHAASLERETGFAEGHWRMRVRFAKSECNAFAGLSVLGSERAETYGRGHRWQTG